MTGTMDRLVYMANQIATAFRHQEPGKAAEATADHILHFWDPRMRSMISRHFESGGEGLDAIARVAVARLNQPAPAAVTHATEFTAPGAEAMSDAG